MKKSRIVEGQIAYILREAESGTAIAEVYRQLEVSKASFYVWKKKYRKVGPTELRELRQLRYENARLTRVVANLTLDMHILGEVVLRNLEAGQAPRTGRLNQASNTDGCGSCFPKSQTA